MEHVAQGKRNADVATSLFITVGTVKRHLDNAYRKLGARNRTEAIARYAEIVNAESDDSADVVRRGGMAFGLLLLPLERELGRLRHPVGLGCHRQDSLKGGDDRGIETGSQQPERD